MRSSMSDPGASVHSGQTSYVSNKHAFSCTFVRKRECDAEKQQSVIHLAATYQCLPELPPLSNYRLEDRLRRLHEQ